MMCEELLLLQDEVKELANEFRNHVKEEHDRWGTMITVQENNNKAIGELAVAVAAQVESTKDIIEAWEAANGAIKVGGWLIDFLKWCSGVAVIGVGAAWILNYFKI